MASLPLFYHTIIPPAGSTLQLDEDTARHVIQVLRMTQGENMLLTDGKGKEATAQIIKAEKKKCDVLIAGITVHERRKVALHLCIGFTRNASRNEWLLEKATELGVSSITPLITERTIKEHFRYDRWQNILVSAMLQSQQYYLPALHDAITLSNALVIYRQAPQKLVAHCVASIARAPIAEMLKPGLETLLLIGPEGDFTEEEVNLCMAQCAGISLGMQRLRTETAAMAACAYFNLINHEG